LEEDNLLVIINIIGGTHTLIWSFAGLTKYGEGLVWPSVCPGSMSLKAVEGAPLLGLVLTATMERRSKAKT